MPLGRCPECDTLRAIVARGVYADGRTRRWHVVEHEVMRCKECTLAVQGVNECSLCGPDSELTLESCSGHKTEIT